jgi:ADP-heptose:LPS heptosyltransferase
MKALFINEVDNLGDQLCILRVLAEYARQHARDRIDVLTPSWSELFVEAPFVRHVHNLRGAGRWRRHTVLARVLGGYGRIIRFDLQRGDRVRKCRQLGWHLIEAYAAMVPIRVTTIEPRIFYRRAAFQRQALSMVDRPFIALAPHSPSCLSRLHPGMTPNKEWPPENWRRLIDRLPESFYLYSFGSAEEEPLTHPRVRPLYGQDIRLVAEMLRHAELLIALDNGLAHLARAAGQRSIVQIHGNHCPPSWATYPGNTVVYTGSPITEVPVDRVWECVEHVLSSRMSDASGLGGKAVALAAQETPR